MFQNRFNRFLHNEAADAADAGATAGAAGDAAAVTTSTTTTGTPGGGGDTGAVTPPARPEWFPEKYYKDGGPEDVEKLGKSYTELQTAFSKKYPHYEDVPAEVGGYNLEPESLPKGVVWAPEVATRFAGVFHANGVGQTQAKAIVDAFLALEADNLEGAGKAYEKQQGEDIARLSEKWGGADKYEAKRAEISAYVTDKLGADENDAALFSHPRIIEFLAKEADYVKALESQLGEDAKAAAKGAVAPGGKFENGASEAQRIMRDPAHPDYERYHKGDAEVAQRVMNLLGSG